MQLCSCDLLAGLWRSFSAFFRLPKSKCFLHSQQHCCLHSFLSTFSNDCVVVSSADRFRSFISNIPTPSNSGVGAAIWWNDNRFAIWKGVLEQRRDTQGPPTKVRDIACQWEVPKCWQLLKTWQLYVSQRCWKRCLPIIRRIDFFCEIVWMTVLFSVTVSRSVIRSPNPIPTCTGTTKSGTLQHMHYRSFKHKKYFHVRCILRLYHPKELPFKKWNVCYIIFR